MVDQTDQVDQIDETDQTYNLIDNLRHVPNNIKNMIPELRKSLTDATEIALAVLGNVDAGKSSLTACLSDRILDNGDGSARGRVFSHEHEKQTGRSSDISSRTIEFSEKHITSFLEDTIVDELDIKKKKSVKSEERSQMKIVCIHDLCGHEKYFGTTTHGVSSTYPDFALLVISPSRGVLQMTKEHYTVTISLNIPVLIVITRADVALKNSCIETEEQIKKLLKKFGRTASFINSYEDYPKYKNGQTIYYELKSKYEYEGKNISVQEDDKDKKNKNKIQTTRNTSDPFFISLKNEIKEYGQNIMDKYEITKEQYEDLEKYINYNIYKYNSVSSIVSNLNSVTKLPADSLINSNASDRQRIVPIIYMSNYDGWNLDTIRDSIMFLRAREIWDVENNSIVKMMSKKLGKPDLGKVDISGSIFYIDRSYTVEGAGLVVSGVNRGDKIKINDRMWVGPINKNFIEVKIKSISK